MILPYVFGVTLGLAGVRCQSGGPGPPHTLSLQRQGALCTRLLIVRIISGDIFGCVTGLSSGSPQRGDFPSRLTTVLTTTEQRTSSRIWTFGGATLHETSSSRSLTTRTCNQPLRFDIHNPVPDREQANLKLARFQTYLRFNQLLDLGKLGWMLFRKLDLSLRVPNRFLPSLRAWGFYPKDNPKRGQLLLNTALLAPYLSLSSSRRTTELRGARLRADSLGTDR